MTKFRHHKYTYAKPFGSPSHRWELVGPEGGVHFTANFYDKSNRVACGLEFHHSARAGRYPNEAPHHRECPLLGEPCWHDGTSLYADETLWPMIQPMLRNGDHDSVFRLLEGEYDDRFKRDETP